MNTQNLKVVVIECPYNTLPDNQQTKALLGEYVSFKLNGFLKEYRHGILPLNGYDFIANLVFLCDESDGTLKPVLGFKSITLERCEYFGMPFEAFQLFKGIENSKHQLVMRNIVQNAKEQNRSIGYNSSWTIAPTWRASHAHKQFARDFSVALFTNYYQTYQVPEILIGGAVRFKVDKIQSFMGFEDLMFEGQKLPPIDCPFLFGEATQVMYLKRFSKEALSLASLYSSLWNSRITIADPTKFHQKTEPFKLAA